MVIKKALISGPTGVIGIALINELINNNIEVYCVCHKGSSKINFIPKSYMVHIIECNVENLNELLDCVKDKIDVFYHLAWYGGTYGEARNNIETNVKNIQYTIDAIKVAKELGCEAFIGAGSQSEYINNNEIKTNKTLPNPESYYSATKLSSMYIGKLYAKSLGIKFYWTRIFSVFGPYGGEHTLIPSTINKMIQGIECDFTKCEQIWDFIYSKDCALALRLIAEKGKDGEIYNIASGDTRYLYEFIMSLHDIVNPECKINIGALPYYDHQSRNLSADISLLQNDCGFKPKYSFEDGIQDYLKILKQKKDNKYDKGNN